MTTAREIMTADVQILSREATLADAARIMRDHGVGALPVVDNDGTLVGIVTDRDLVVGGLADGQEPSSTVAAYTEGIVSTVSTDEDIDRIVDIMGDQQIKRLVVEEGGRVVGMISEADLARNVAEDKIVHFVKMVYGRG